MVRNYSANQETAWAERIAVSTIWFALAETINGLYQSNSVLLITLKAGDQSPAVIPYQKVSGHPEAVHAVMCKG